MNEIKTANPGRAAPARRARRSGAGIRAVRQFTRRLLAAIDSGRIALAFCVLTGALVAIFQVSREQPLYDAHAEILLNPVDATQLTLVYSNSAKRAVISLPTEAQVLVSETVLGRVAKELDLANDPRFSPFARYGIRTDGNQPDVRGAMITLLREGLSVHYDGDEPDQKMEDIEDSQFGRGRKRGKSVFGPRIINLTFRGVHPDVAAEILQSEIQVYKDRNLELRHAAIVRVSDQLSASMDDFKQKVESEQRRLLGLQRSVGLNELAGKSDTIQTELLQLRRADTRAKTEIRVRQAETGAGSSQDEPATLYRLGTAEELQPLGRDISLIRLQLAELQAVFGPVHPLVQELEAGKAQLERELASIQSRRADRLAARLQLARLQAQLLESDIAKLARSAGKQQGAAIEASTLQVQLARDSELFYVLVNNVRTAEIDAGYGSIAVDILREPDVPAEPIAKNFARLMLLYSIAGLALGLLSAMLLASRTEVSVSVGWQNEPAMGTNFRASLPWVKQVLALNRISVPWWEKIGSAVAIWLRP